MLNIPRPPYSMLGYNRTIARTNINVLINIEPGVGGGRKRRGKKGNLPNTFDDDCSSFKNGRQYFTYLCLLLLLLLVCIVFLPPPHFYCFPSPSQHPPPPRFYYFPSYPTTAATITFPLLSSSTTTTTFLLFFFLHLHTTTTSTFLLFSLLHHHPYYMSFAFVWPKRPNSNNLSGRKIVRGVKTIEMWRG